LFGSRPTYNEEERVMRFSRLALGCLVVSIGFIWPVISSAQKYPEKTVRMVVAFPTGASHILAILVSEKLREGLGQPFVPDFKPGAGGNVAAEIVAKAPGDGYTLLLTSGSIAISPSLFPKLGYDTLRDFTPISLLASVPNVMVVHPSVPAKTLAELIKLAKTQPGKLNYGSGGFGSGSQLGSELFKSLAKIEIAHVPYKGAAIAMNAMLSGEVDMVTSTVPATIPYINAGRLRGLVIMAPERIAALPSVPTAAQAGMPELVVTTWYGLFAPANVRAEVIERLNSEIGRFMRTPELVAQLTKVGLDPAPNTPAEFAKFVRAEADRWARVIRAANIKPE
jgi:tripartite-type tricarboxylate transporter receptor subunit TctC